MKYKPEIVTTKPKPAKFVSRAKKAMIDKSKRKAANAALERNRDRGVVV